MCTQHDDGTVEVRHIASGSPVPAAPAPTRPRVVAKAGEKHLDEYFTKHGIQLSRPAATQGLMTLEDLPEAMWELAKQPTGSYRRAKVSTSTIRR